jgi:hypothetical protein
LAGAQLERLPHVVFEIKLSPPHDV